MTQDGASVAPHWPRVERQWSGYRVTCRGCDLYEQHEDQTTAHREAARHQLAASSDLSADARTRQNGS